MIKLNEFYVFTENPKVKYQLFEIGNFFVWIKDIISGTPYKISKESFELNYKLAE